MPILLIYSDYAAVPPTQSANYYYTFTNKATPQNIPTRMPFGTGLQIINFWQDIAKGLRIGRIYLPLMNRTICVNDAQIAQGNCG